MNEIHHLKRIWIAASTVVLGTVLGVPLTAFCQVTAHYTPYAVVTISGSPRHAGTNDGTNGSALYWSPAGIAMDTAGNVYVSDSFKETIRKISPIGTNWVTTTIAGQIGKAGSSDGTNNGASFSGPNSLAVDGATNIYIADSGNRTIRKMAPVGTNWVVTTLAGMTGISGTNDGIGSAALFGSSGPNSVALDQAGNIYASDTANSTIRQLTPSGTNWSVSTIAGRPGSSGRANGTNGGAQFYSPNSLVLDNAGNIYVVDSGNTEIRKITPVGTNWVVTTIAGFMSGEVDGTNANASFFTPGGMAQDESGNLFVGDSTGTIRKLTAQGTNWVVTTAAGLSGNYGTNDGTGNIARFGNAGSSVKLSADSFGNVYITDNVNSIVRKCYPENVPAVIGSAGTGFGFTNGQFSMNLTAPPGQLVVVEASSDFQSWQPIWTNTFPTNGMLLFNDPQTGGYTDRFYRARTP